MAPSPRRALLAALAAGAALAAAACLATALAWARYTASLGPIDLAASREGSTIVVDRGMAFAENIAELRRRKLHYVIAAGQKERDRLLAEFETVDGFEEVIRQPSPRNPGQKKSSVRVKAHP